MIVKIWTKKQLKKHGQSKLDTFYRYYCILNQLALPYKSLSADKAIELLVDKPVEEYYVARERFVKYKKQQSLKKFVELVADGKIKKRSDASRIAENLKQNLKKGNKANSIDIKQPARLQKALFKQLKKAVNLHKQTLSWAKLSHQFIDAYVIKSFNALNDFQSEIFFKYVKLFFKMVKKRGYRCLWDERVYYCISVQDWLRKLVCMSSVEWYDEDDDEDTCLVKQTVKGRATIDRSSKNKNKVQDKYLVEILCSLINRETTASNDPLIYGRDYDAAHTCRFKRCINVYHIRRTTKAANWNEHVEHNLV